MSGITVETIGSSRYAPDATNLFCLYSTERSRGLSFAQLLAATCLRIGMQCETQSVNLMNQVSIQTDDIDTLSDYVSNVAAGAYSSGEWEQVRSDLMNRFGIDGARLPEHVSGIPDQLRASEVLREELERRTFSAQRTMVKVKAFISRRDVAFTTGTGLVSSNFSKVIRRAGNLV